VNNRFLVSVIKLKGEEKSKKKKLVELTELSYFIFWLSVQIFFLFSMFLGSLPMWIIL